MLDELIAQGRLRLPPGALTAQSVPPPVDVSFASVVELVCH
jgi:hypothetical protein